MLSNKNDIKLDYSFYNNQAKDIISWIMTYFPGEIKLLSKKPIFSDRLDRDNSSGARVDTFIYKSFYVVFTIDKSKFMYGVYFDKPAKVINSKFAILSVLLFDTYEEYRKLSFNPTYDNVHIMLDKLNEFINYLLVEKEKHPDYSYYKIGMLKVCEIKGWDPEKRIKE
ncbi:MAG: hypothetical protein ACRCTA_04540 [Bacilli bacterium]